MTAHAERKSFVVSVTLTELMFLLFFLLLLSAVFRLVELERDLAQEKEAHAKAESQASELRRTLEAAKTALAPAHLLSDDEFIELVKNAVVASGKTVTSQLRELKRELVIVNGQLIAERNAHEATQAQAAALEKQIEDLRGVDPDGARESLAQCTTANTDLRGQMKECRRRLGGGGMDHPPCWADSDTGKIEYLLETTMEDDGIRAIPAWPAHRGAAAEALPAVSALIGSKHTPQAFSAAGQPLLEWSKNQDPECRHFVRIIDRTTSVDLHKKARYAVESVFYKFEVN